MHNFDVEQRRQQDALIEQFGDHAFTLRGQEFHIRRIVPYGALKKISAIGNAATDFEVYDAIENGVLSMLASQDDRDRFQKLLDDTTSEFPVTYLELIDIQKWILAEASGRPPTQPASSSGSSATNGSDATASSSPPQDAP